MSSTNKLMDSHERKFQQQIVEIERKIIEDETVDFLKELKTIKTPSSAKHQTPSSSKSEDKEVLSPLKSSQALSSLKSQSALSPLKSSSIQPYTTEDKLTPPDISSKNSEYTLEGQFLKIQAEF